MVKLNQQFITCAFKVCQATYTHTQQDGDTLKLTRQKNDLLSVSFKQLAILNEFLGLINNSPHVENVLDMHRGGLQLYK